MDYATSTMIFVNLSNLTISLSIFSPPQTNRFSRTTLVVRSGKAKGHQVSTMDRTKRLRGSTGFLEVPQDPRFRNVRRLLTHCTTSSRLVKGKGSPMWQFVNRGTN